MKGIVLAGGSGSRLMPLTKVTNKHLLPVGREPMIFHPIKKLLRAGIRDILVVTGTEHMGAVVGLLGSGVEFDCSFTYRVQDQPGGIAQALDLARDFAMGNRMMVVLGDNILEDELGLFAERFAQQGRGARILLKFAVNGVLMGGSALRREQSTISIEAIGTAPIRLVELIRNNQVIGKWHEEKETIRFEHLDRNLPPDLDLYYYVRLTQEDGQMAWLRQYGLNISFATCRQI